MFNRRRKKECLKFCSFNLIVIRLFATWIDLVLGSFVVWALFFFQVTYENSLKVAKCLESRVALFPTIRICEF
jgi:hypothetical protein